MSPLNLDLPFFVALSPYYTHKHLFWGQSFLLLDGSTVENE